MKAMKDRLMRLYKEGQIDDAGLESAVKKGWITEEEKEEIIASKNPEASPVE
jgi:hypothetical protein